jgi:soluble lytic murein transglycosylase
MVSKQSLSHLLLIAALLSVGFAPGQADAQRKPRAGAGASAGRAEQTLSADDAVVAARLAAANSQKERVISLASAVPESHPLQAYLPYWELKLRLSEDRNVEGKDFGPLDVDVQAFLTKHGKSLVSDLLRRDWMLQLGKRRDWALFDAYYPGWQLRDDTRVFCLAGISSLAKSQAISEESSAALNEAKGLGSECGDFLEALTKSGTYKRADVLKRMYEAIEDNSVDSMRRAGALLGLDPAAIDMALNRPAKVFELKWGQDVALIAVSRLARQDPDVAAKRLEESGLGFSAAQSSFAWSQVAASAMRKLQPEALEWTRKAMSFAGPVGALQGESMSWMLRAALRAQDWKLVSELYSRLPLGLKQEPVWAYWQGRALMAAKKTEEAHLLWQGIASLPQFYGQLAAEELGQLTTVPPSVAPPTEVEVSEAAKNAGLLRAQKFYEVGLRMEGNREWNYQLRGLSDRQLLAYASYACKRSILDRCVNTADRTQGEHNYSLRFLTPFKEQLTREAQERSLDPAWVYGLIRQESRFLMDARSSVGASGLMQVMPATGRWIARKLGVADFRAEQLGDMDTNLRFGTFYLKSVLDDLDGSPVLASAAYNAGPNRPRQWRVNLPASVEGAIFAEMVPFSETRDYVKKVLSNATYYAAMFSGKPQSLKARLGTISPRALAQSELP